MCWTCATCATKWHLKNIRVIQPLWHYARDCSSWAYEIYEQYWTIIVLDNPRRSSKPYEFFFCPRLGDKKKLIKSWAIQCLPSSDMSLDLLFIIALALWQLWMVCQKDGKRLNSRKKLWWLCFISKTGIPNLYQNSIVYHGWSMMFPYKLTFFILFLCISSPLVKAEWKKMAVIPVLQRVAACSSSLDRTPSPSSGQVTEKYPCSSHRNSWDVWMFIPLKMVFTGIDPWPYDAVCLFGFW